VNSSEIKSTIFEHEEFKKFSEKINEIYSDWEKTNLPLLTGIKIGTNPKKLIEDISENILKKFLKLKLIEKYDLYQNLMTYWEDTMQDDLYLISLNGWKVSLFYIKNKKGIETKEWDSELIPKNIIIEKYFKIQKEELDDLESKSENMEQEMQTLEEEHQEEDMFNASKSDSGKIGKTSLDTRIKKIKNNPDHIEELKILNEYKEIFDKKSEITSQIKTKKTELDKILMNKYKELTEHEIKELVINDKWLATIHDSINKEMEQISHKLARRINELVDRYETPLPELSKEVQTLSKKVDDHLEKMGFK